MATAASTAKMSVFLSLLLGLLGLLTSSTPVQASSQSLDLPMSSIALPPGFAIDLYTSKHVPNARTLVLSNDTTNGTIVYVSTNSLSKVYALIDFDNDGTADSIVTVIANLTAPTGLAYANGSLWVATTPTIYRYDGVDALARAGKMFTNPHVVLDGLGDPSDHNHHTMTIGPDNMIYFNLGAPFNIGIPPAVDTHDLSYATIVKMAPDGTNVSTFATGVRNSVGMQFHPESHILYFSCNGRNNLGDDVPDDYIASAPTSGLDFGFPHCHREGFGDRNLRQLGSGQPYPDPEFPPPLLQNATFNAQQEYCKDHQTAPVQVLGPHVAALGMTFYTGRMFPAAYHMAVLNAQHGSYKLTHNLGYRVMALTLNEDGSAHEYSVLAAGWLQPNGSAWGRPADVLQMPDGSLLVSDDTAGAVYRITYNATLAHNAQPNATADSLSFINGILPEM